MRLSAGARRTAANCRGHFSMVQLQRIIRWGCTTPGDGLIRTFTIDTLRWPGASYVIITASTARDSGGKGRWRKSLASRQGKISIIYFLGLVTPEATDSARSATSGEINLLVPKQSNRVG